MYYIFPKGFPEDPFQSFTWRSRLLGPPRRPPISCSLSAPSAGPRGAPAGGGGELCLHRGDHGPPLRGQDLRADRGPHPLHPGGGHGADRGLRRQGQRLRLQEDQLRGGGGKRRLQAPQGQRAGHPRADGGGVPCPVRGMINDKATAGYGPFFLFPAAPICGKMSL